LKAKNIIVEYRYPGTEPERLPSYVAELIRLKSDTQDTDPVGNGFVASLSRPGRNITGLPTLTPELSGKRLELLKEIIPKLSRLAVFGTSSMPGHAQSLREIELAAGTFKVQVQHLDVVDPKDIETAFQPQSWNVPTQSSR
jgi:putative ABC transport system substrate-binding protein